MLTGTLGAFLSCARYWPANALKRANINTISQVLALSDSDLMSLRNFGQKSLDELRAALADHGYAMPPSEEEEALSEEEEAPAEPEE